MTRACTDVCGLAPSSNHLPKLRLVGTPDTLLGDESDERLIQVHSPATKFRSDSKSRMISKAATAVVNKSWVAVALQGELAALGEIVIRSANDGVRCVFTLQILRMILFSFETCCEVTYIFESITGRFLDKRSN
jgi:hypothetical protein